MRMDLYQKKRMNMKSCHSNKGEVMKAIKISDEAYNAVSLLADEVDRPISEVASMLIINKDRCIRMSEKTIKTLEVDSNRVTG